MLRLGHPGGGGGAEGVRMGVCVSVCVKIEEFRDDFQLLTQMPS